MSPCLKAPIFCSAAIYERSRSSLSRVSRRRASVLCALLIATAGVDFCLWTMADDSFSASELRNRYSNKPSAQRLDDNQLSASQLRARHEIANRQFNQSDGIPTVAIVGGVIALIVVAYFALGG